jgi:hypothetical protein
LLQAFPTDTWTWDGSVWRQAMLHPSPPGRYLHAMAYDSWRRQVVLFGGLATVSEFNDTWIWNGAAWTRKVPATAPPPAWNFAMDFDATRGVVVLFGGERHGPTVARPGRSRCATTTTRIRRTARRPRTGSRADEAGSSGSCDSGLVVGSIGSLRFVVPRGVVVGLTVTNGGAGTIGAR